MSTPLLSTLIGSGPIVFFVEVLEAKNGTHFFRITETRKDAGDNKALTRMLVFGDAGDQLVGGRPAGEV